MTHKKVAPSARNQGRDLRRALFGRARGSRTDLVVRRAAKLTRLCASALLVLYSPSSSPAASLLSTTPSSYLFLRLCRKKRTTPRPRTARHITDERQHVNHELPAAREARRGVANPLIRIYVLHLTCPSGHMPPSSKAKSGRAAALSPS